MKKKKGLYFPAKEFQSQAWINQKNIYAKAAKNPVKFWEGLARELSWLAPWKKAFVHNPPAIKWFAGGKLNITLNALDRNLPARKNKVALIWEPESPTERERVFTYYQLYQEVNRFANALRKLGVKKGDPVGIYLPMIPEVLIAMLACARIGAVHSVVFSAFSPKALQVRLQDTKTKILITADGYWRGGKIIDLKSNADTGIKATDVKKVIVVKRAGNKIRLAKGKDLWWHELVAGQKDTCPAQSMDSEDLMFILYTSGSTGKPKGCCHICGGYAVQANFTAKWIFDLKDSDIFWSTADVGWITGHTYSCYGPLLCGATFVVYEGVPNWPTPDRWCQIIEKYGVTKFYTAPTAIRMFQEYGSALVKKHNLESLQIIGSVGEPIDEKAWQWYFQEVGKENCPLVDTWWQTETGGILITSLPGLGPFKPTFTGLPFPGLKFDILDEKGRSLPPEKQGNLVLLPPFAPGLVRTIYKNPQKCLETYWSKYGSINSPLAGKIYFTSDGAYRDKNGLFRVVGRVDDVIKVAGHRLATGEMENVIALDKDVSGCAVIGIPDKIKGEVPAVFAVFKKGQTVDAAKKQIIDRVRKEIGPIATPKEVYLVADLPKTRSGKIMRRILRNLLTGGELGDLSTLANPESVKEIKKILAGTTK